MNELLTEFSYIMYVFTFFVGTVLASLGGLLAYRIPHIYGWYDDKSDRTLGFNFPSSHCESCKKKLSWIELIPVIGYLITHGKCHNCHFEVPKRYPLSEITLGVIFVINQFLFGLSFEFLVISALVFTSYVAALIDWETTYIPDFATSSMLFLGLLCSPVSASMESSIFGASLGWLLFSATFWLISAIKRTDAYASGDVAFGAMAGAWLGVEYILEYLFLSSVLFIVMAIRVRNDENPWVPMGPALAIALIFELWLIKVNFHLFPILNFYY